MVKMDNLIKSTKEKTRNDAIGYGFSQIEAINETKREISRFFSEQDVLQTACGTGYWTRILNRSAHRTIAEDFCQSANDIARILNFEKCQIDLCKKNVYLLGKAPNPLTSFFCGFFLSEIPLFHIRTFFEALHSKLNKESLIVFIDTPYIEGMTPPISRRDNSGNTYQVKTHSDGSKHEVLKNFFTEKDIRAFLPCEAKEISVNTTAFYWMLKYTI